MNGGLDLETIRRRPSRLASTVDGAESSQGP